VIVQKFWMKITKDRKWGSTYSYALAIMATLQNLLGRSSREFAKGIQFGI
jgi:hypothetical protein